MNTKWDKMYDWVMDWMVFLPITITGYCRFKIIRILGIFFMIPWTLATIFITCWFIIIAVIGMLIEDI